MPVERMASVRLRELATRRERREFRWGLDELPRLKSLASAAEIAAVAAFRLRPEGLPEVALAITGGLSLTCQRCLRPMGHTVDLACALTIVEEGAAAPGDADAFDLVVAGPDGLSLAHLVEDEILAGLQISPRHEASAACAAGSVQAAGPADGVQKHRPFADLAALMKGEPADDTD